MVPSEGGALSFRGPNYEGYVGAGELNGSFRLGSYFKTSFDSYQLALGDQSIAFGLPTDILGGNQYFLTRGAGATLAVGHSKLFLFGGATTLAAGSPLFQAFQTQVPLGMVFWDRPVSDKLHFYSRNVFSDRQSFIQGFDFRPRKWLKTAVSAGTGSNRPYVAAAADIDRDWFTVKAALISASDRFRRISTPSLFAAEPDRENIVATIKPYSSLVLTAGHQNFLAPQGNNLQNPFMRASVDQFQSSLDLAQFRLGAGVFRSGGPAGHNVSDGFSVARRIGRSVDASANYYQSLSGPGLHTSYLMATVRETISPKLTLLEGVNRTQGNISALFGGSYTTNRLSFGIDYQTLYMPFLKNPVVTGVGVNVNLKLWGGFQLHGQTFRSPDGRLRYTASMSTLLARGPHAHVSEVQTYRMPGYIVRGHVRDVTGAPIEGAAVRIGNDIVYSNAAGEFLAREKHSGLLPLEVVLKEFTNPRTFTVISAPATVLPALEDSAPDVVIVLRANVQTRQRPNPAPPSPTESPTAPSNSSPAPESPTTTKTPPATPPSILPQE